jgi:hypothetical protein
MLTASSEASETCNAVLRLRRNVDTEHRLRSRVIDSQPISGPFECYLKCLKNCRCLSYNVCHGGKLCELNSARKENDTFFYDKSGECDYHDFNFHERVSLIVYGGFDFWGEGGGGGGGGGEELQNMTTFVARVL